MAKRRALEYGAVILIGAMCGCARNAGTATVHTSGEAEARAAHERVAGEITALEQNADDAIQQNHFETAQDLLLRCMDLINQNTASLTKTEAIALSSQATTRLNYVKRVLDYRQQLRDMLVIRDDSAPYGDLTWIVDKFPHVSAKKDERIRGTIPIPPPPMGKSRLDELMRKAEADMRAAQEATIQKMFPPE